MKVLVIGGVAAGMSAASKLRREMQNATVVVVEKGGEVSYGACGLPYFVSGINSDENKLRIRSSDEIIESGIDLRLYHEAIKVNAQQKEVLIRDLLKHEDYFETYDFLVVTTGAEAIRPLLPGIDLKGIYTIRNISDAKLIKNEANSNVEKVGIVGGGYIGLEMAEAFLEMGKKVVLFEVSDQLLQNFDHDIANVVLEHLKMKGVDIHLGEGVQRFEGSEKIEKIVTAMGEYSVDLALLAVGVKPNTRFMLDTGIKTLKNGAILVDSYMKTSLPDVYAAGDCATVRHMLTEEDCFVPLGTNANKQGRYLADTISGKSHPFKTCLGTTMIKICDLELGKTGLTETESKLRNIPYATSIVHGMNHAPYYPTPEQITVKLVYHQTTKKILGAQLIGGKGAALRINVFSVCISNHMNVRDIGELDLGYAPPFSMPWDIIHISANVIK